MDLWCSTTAVLRCFVTRDHPGGQPWTVQHIKINQRTQHTPPPGASRRNSASQRCQMALGAIARRHPSNAEGEKRPERAGRPGSPRFLGRRRDGEQSNNSLTGTRAPTWQHVIFWLSLYHSSPTYPVSEITYCLLLISSPSQTAQNKTPRCVQ